MLALLFASATALAATNATWAWVAPKSLYPQQLQDRLGPQALANIGYGNGGTTAINEADFVVHRGVRDLTIRHRTLSFFLERASSVHLKVYKMDGQLVRELKFAGTPGQNILSLGSGMLAPSAKGLGIVELNAEGTLCRIHALFLN